MTVFLPRTFPGLPGVRGILAGLSCSLLVLGLVACSGGGGAASPTDPGMPTAMGGSASITGQVSVTGSTGGSLTAGPAVTPGAGPGAPSHLASADSSGSGLTVRVQGTNLSTTTDASGHFSLQGVPTGNQVLLFLQSSTSADVPIAGIQPAETIQITVEVSGSSANVTDIQRSGGDTSGSDDNGGDDNGGAGGAQPQPVDLSLEIDPDDWNLNFDHSAGTVTAFIRGSGFDQVVLDSIVLAGDNPDAAALAPVSATREGDHDRARFAKNQVLGLLDDPQSGSVHTVTLQFEIEGQEGTSELMADVTIEGEDEPGDDNGEELGDLSLEIDPDHWNVNFDQSSGNVTAFIRGNGLDAIDTDSIALVGDNMDATPLPATMARLEGEHVRAQFPKNQVLGLLDMPVSGSEHTVTVSFTAHDGADQLELQDDVKIVGNDQGDDNGEDQGDDHGNDNGGDNGGDNGDDHGGDNHGGGNGGNH